MHFLQDVRLFSMFNIAVLDVRSAWRNAAAAPLDVNNVETSALLPL